MSIKTAAQRLGVRVGVGPVDPTGPDATVINWDESVTTYPYRFPATLNTATDTNAALLVNEFGGALDLCGWAVGNTDYSHYGQALRWTAPGVYSFQGVDEAYAYAVANGMDIWISDPAYSDRPAWIVNGGYTAAQLTTLLHDWYQAFYTRYPAAYATTLGNEFLSLDGTLDGASWGTASIEWWYLRTSIGQPGGFTRLQFLGTIYGWVKGFNPNIRIVYSNHSAEGVLSGTFSGTTTYDQVRDGLYLWAQRIKAAGLPVDGIGLQSHFFSSVGTFDPAGYTAQIRRLDALGFDVSITEFDVRNDGPLWVQRHTDLIGAILAAKCVKSLSFWSVRDPLFYWAPGALYSTSYAGGNPYDSTRTAAAAAVESALNAAPIYLEAWQGEGTPGGVRVRGHRKPDTQTISVSGATVGAVVYTGSTGWYADATDLAPGTNTLTVSDGTDTVQVDVEGRVELDISSALGVSWSARDAYYAPRNLALGRSYLAGPAELLDAPNDRTDLRPRFGLTSAPAFAAAWAEAEALAESFGFDSLPAFVAAWSKAETIAHAFGFASVDAYAIAIREDAAPWPHAIGFESSGAFVAAWARTLVQAQAFGYSGVSSFAATWNQVAELRPLLGFGSDAQWESAFSLAFATASAHGLSSAATFLANWADNQEIAASLGIDAVAQFWDDMSGGLEVGAILGLASSGVVREHISPTGLLLALRPTLHLTARRMTETLTASRPTAFLVADRRQ